MPIDQYIMFQYRNNPYFGNVSYHLLYFVKDIIRGILIPAWIAVAAGIVGYIAVLDILGLILQLVGCVLVWLLCGPVSIFGFIFKCFHQ
jgi:hypothetical protein